MILTKSALEIAFAVVAIGGALALAWWIQVRRFRPRGRDPRCARCGYIVRGLPALHCPECGGDLREVGIVTQRQGSRVGRAGAIVLWSIAIGVLTAGAAARLERFFVYNECSRSYRCKYSHAWKKPYEGFVLTARGKAFRYGLPARTPSRDVPMTHVELKLLTTEGKSSVLHVRDWGMSVSTTTAEAAAAQVLTADLLIEWMSSAGIDASAQRTRDEAEAIFATVRDTLRSNVKPGRSPVFAGFGWKGRSTNFRVFSIGRYVVCGVFGLLWIGGVLRLLHRLRSSSDPSN